MNKSNRPTDKQKENRLKDKKQLAIFIVTAAVVGIISYPLAYENFRAHLFVTVFAAIIISYFWRLHI